MKYLRTFLENNIYSIDLGSILPDELTIDYEGIHTFKKGNIMKNADMFQITYVNEKNEFGFTDCLEIDVYTVQDSGKIRLDVDVTVGDFVVGEFTIESPNKINVIQNMTYGTKFCHDCPIFAFTDESIEKLCKFFNHFDKIKIEPYDLRFLNIRDDYSQDYSTPVTGGNKEYRMKSLPHMGGQISQDGTISYFQQDWFEKLLPDTLKIVSDPKLFKLNFDQSLEPIEKKEFTFEKNDCAINNNIVQFNYWMVPDYEPGEEVDDGEPSCIEFDICFVKNVDGIKLIVDITYGDNISYQFSIESPNKINIGHYTGVGSLYDKNTHFGFKSESIKDLVKFFNSFNHGINLTEKDLAFLDEREDSYQHDIYNKKHLYNDESDLIKFGN